MKKLILTLILIINLCIIPTWAFVVQRIEIEGLQRITPETAYSYLSIKQGQNLTPDKTSAVIRDLYKTGFFERIELARSGNTLVIHVVERPTIGQLKISGNSFIPTDKLTSVMKSMDIAEGRVYNQAIIDRIKQSLLNQYYELGRYNARVDVTATPLCRNRMLVKIDISEGLVAKICQINIIGNHAFSERCLKRQLTLTTPGLFTFLTQSDRYSQEKLEQSMESLRNYYLDHGYLKFAVKSSQVSITPDRKTIFLTIVIEEGLPYHVNGVELTGDLIVPREVLMKRICIRPGDCFSRQAVINAEKHIGDALGNQGYLYAQVTLIPKVDDTCRQVFLTFNVKPGRRIYIRHIFFSENSKTNDEVLRREILQMEGAIASTYNIEESKHQLSMLPFIKDIQLTVVPVPGSRDQADVNYKVTEDNAAQVNFTVGYSQLYGVQVGAGFNQKNFLGTGKTFGMNVTRNRYEQFFGINYTNPYYTPDGISRSINMSASKVDPAKGNLTSSYTLNQFDGSVLYNIPIGQEKGAFNRVQLGYGYEKTIVHLSNPVSNEVQNFVNQHGRNFGQIDLLSGISRDSRDKAIFPTSGALHTVGLNVYVPGGSGALKYYSVAYNGKIYLPLTETFIATVKGQAGYGRGFSKVEDFPFFKNYYAGGIDSVRGYLGNSLGPRDSNDKPTGGNALVAGSIALIFPNYISDNLRTSVFVDAGNVYNTYNNRAFSGTPSGPVRYSSGIEGDWLTMFGLIDVSLAKAINKQPGDQLEAFQFSLGANFG